MVSPKPADQAKRKKFGTNFGTVAESGLVESELNNDLPGISECIDDPGPIEFQRESEISNKNFDEKMITSVLSMQEETVAVSSSKENSKLSKKISGRNLLNQSKDKPPPLPIKEEKSGKDQNTTLDPTKDVKKPVAEKLQPNKNLDPAALAIKQALAKDSEKAAERKLNQGSGQNKYRDGELAITGTLHKFDKRALSDWLSRRQTAMGGFNGRPEKLLDVCYSWWVQSSLCILKKQNQVNLKNLQGYVYQCQDDKGTFFSYGGCAIIDYVGFAIGLGMRLMCFIRFSDWLL